MSVEPRETVKFVKSYRQYTEGDIAGFKPYFVNELIKRGVAVRHGKKNSSGRKKLKTEELAENRQGMKGHSVEK